MNMQMASIPRSKYKNTRGDWPIHIEPEYQIWNGILGRCLTPTNQSFHKYGGKGIGVCKSWLDFWNFIDDMGRRPSKQHSIDRVENSLGYFKANCRWATRLEQSINRTFTHFIEFEGRTQCLTDWAREVGISPTTLLDRLRRGWKLERALSAPKQTQETMNRGYRGRYANIS